MNQSRTCPINLVWEWLSSQAVCHSFIPALLGMMIGSQSTSNRWIAAQLGWLSGTAVYARVQSVASGGARPCVLTLYACLFLWTTAHLCYSISHLIGILSFLNHHRRCRARCRACCLAAEQNSIPANKISWFLPSNCYHNAAKGISVEISICDDITRAATVKDGVIYERC